MKSELERILSMTKAGTIDEAQAAQLIEALQMKAPERPVSKPSSILGDVLDAVRSAMDGTNSTTGVRASELEANELSMSRIRLLDGRDHVFEGNTVSMSSIDRLVLTESEFRNNVLRSTRFDDGALHASKLLGSQFMSASVEGLRVDRSQIDRLQVSSSSLDQLHLSNEALLREVQVRSSSLKKVALTASTIANVALSGVHLQNLSLDGSELMDGHVSGAHVSDLTLTRSRWLTTFLRIIRLDEVEVVDSVFNDVLFSGSESWRKKGFEKVRFEGCTFGKVVFSECRFKNVTIKDVQLTDLTIDGVQLSDCEITGTTEFRKAVQKRGG